MSGAGIVTREESAAALASYASIPSRLEVRCVFDVSPNGGATGGFTLVEREVAAPYLKDYDATGDGGPLGWPARFDVSGWGVVAAYSGGRRVGGAVIVPGADPSIATLWDIRVSGDVWRRGVGSALFRSAEAWSAARGFRFLDVETQNVNVAACRFYASQGCILVAIDPNAYPELPEETQLSWRKEVGP